MNFPWVATMTIRDNPMTGSKLVPSVRDSVKFYNWLSTMFKEGDKVWLTVKKPSKSRTHEQFKYLYSCVYTPIAEDVFGVANAGTLEQTDGFMKYKLLKVNPDTPLEYIKNKTDLDRAGLAEYIDACRQHAASMGIETQDPIGE